MMIVSPRDFVVLIRRCTFPDGSQGLVSFSIDDYENAPPEASGVVRADMKVGGWYFKTIKPPNYSGEDQEDDYDPMKYSTLMKNLAINDLKGSLPKFIANAGALAHRQSLVSLRKLVDEKIEKGQFPTPKQVMERYRNQPFAKTSQ
jgi:hypothetical protein